MEQYQNYIWINENDKSTEIHIKIIYRKDSVEVNQRSLHIKVSRSFE